MKQLQQRQYTGKGGIYPQLTFPISENTLIDEHEPVYVANAQLEELDYRKLYQAYSPRGRKSAAELRIMFKLLVYGYKTSSGCLRESMFRTIDKIVSLNPSATKPERRRNTSLNSGEWRI